MSSNVGPLAQRMLEGGYPPEHVRSVADLFASDLRDEMVSLIGESHFDSFLVDMRQRADDWEFQHSDARLPAAGPGVAPHAPNRGTAVGNIDTEVEL